MDNLRDKERRFCPAFVGACHVQTATDRFGHEAKRAILDRERISLGLHPAGLEWPADWPGSESEDGEFDDIPANSIYRLVPSMQSYRNNLTALSQKYNLYFTAYRSTIFVYAPRSVPQQTLPRHPDLRLATYPSPVANVIGGYLDPEAPHAVNHLIVGLLGQEEIILTSHDDGDVTAFYTRDVVEHILRKSGMPSVATSEQQRTPSSSASRFNKPRPFFQENVGVSAWGLAIHEKSRLIAVSSNRFEITVFAPALTTSTGRPQTENCDCQSCCEGVEERVRRRARNWRIVLSLGPLANNIPNISFVNDKYGNAHKICAVDIKGAMWLVDIWKPQQAAVRVMQSTSSLLKSEEFWPVASRGWGILALENKYFLTVHSEEELLGAPFKDLEIIPKLQAGPYPMVNMSRYIRDLPENPCTQSVNQMLSPRPFAIADEHNQAIQASEDDSDFGLGPSDEEEAEEEEEEEEGEEGAEGLEDSSEIDNGDENEGENNDGYDDDVIFYSVNPNGGVALQSDISLELVNQPVEESLTTITPVVVVEPPAAATIVGEAPLAQEEGIGYLHVSGNSETAMILQDLFTDLFTPPGESPSPCLSTSMGTGTGTGTSATDHADSRGAPFLPCVKKASPHHIPTLLDMAYMPHSGGIFYVPRETITLARFLKRPTVYNENSQGYVSALGRFAERYHVIRTYEKDLEMRTLAGPNQKGLPEYGILCPYALTMGLSPGRAMRPQFRATSRLSMVVHIPELFLIVIGSPIGRVLLATPTRLAQPVEKRSGLLHHGLRLEWVLPRQSDEAVFRTSKRPLHGMAIGPVQEDAIMGKKDERGRAAGPRRYRLMLHYRNHDILTYELSREEQSGKVCIF